MSSFRFRAPAVAVRRAAPRCRGGVSSVLRLGPSAQASQLSSYPPARRLAAPGTAA